MQSYSHNYNPRLWSTSTTALLGALLYLRPLTSSNRRDPQRTVTAAHPPCSLFLSSSSSLPQLYIRNEVQQGSAASPHTTRYIPSAALRDFWPAPVVAASICICCRPSAIGPSRLPSSTFDSCAIVSFRTLHRSSAVAYSLDPVNRCPVPLYTCISSPPIVFHVAVLLCAVQLSTRRAVRADAITSRLTPHCEGRSCPHRCPKNCKRNTTSAKHTMQQHFNTRGRGEQKTGEAKQPKQCNCWRWEWQAKL